MAHSISNGCFAMCGSQARPVIHCQRFFKVTFPQQRKIDNFTQRKQLSSRYSGSQKLVVHASKGSGETNVVTLPVFPLSVVALPSADVPLQIFEARYRVLFSTLLAGSEGLEDGLINPEKPWCGTRRFGMSFYDPQNGGLASIGTVLEIKEHTRMEDGRLLVQNIGCERFRIRKVVEEKPVLVCEVEYLPLERKPYEEEVVSLANEVGQLFRNVVQLAVKLRDASLPQARAQWWAAICRELRLRSVDTLYLDLADPSQLKELDPPHMSFWVASLFSGNPYQQQALLEMDSTLERLKAEEALLSSTLKYLSAQAALQGAFKSSSSSSSTASDVPPPGGPD